MRIVYAEMVNKRLFDQREGTWMKGELVRLHSETGKLKDVVENGFSAHCSSRLTIIRFHLLDHFVDDLEWFGSFFMYLGPFEPSTVLVESALG